MDIVIVTRHPALVELIRERNLVTGNVNVIAHAAPDDVRGKHVFGILPLSLAALADRVTELPLTMAPEDRGVELPIGRLRLIAGPAVTYKVTQIACENCRP